MVARTAVEHGGLELPELCERRFLQWVRHVRVVDAAKRIPIRERFRALKQIAIGVVIPFAVVRCLHLALVEMAVDDHEVIDLRVARHVGDGALFFRDDDALDGFVARQAVLEIVRFRQRLQRERVVVEEHEVLGEPLDAVEVELDDIRVVRRQVCLRYVILMPHDAELRMIESQEGWHMPPGHEHDVAHPRQVFFHSTEPEMKVLPALEMNVRIRARLDGIPFPARRKFPPPGRVRIIQPRQDDVDVCHAVPSFLKLHAVLSEIFLLFCRPSLYRV